MTTHTPGPWKAEAAIPGSGKGWFIVTTQDVILAMVVKGDTTDTPDAYQAAASPDLLAACQAALARLTEDARCLDCGVHSDAFNQGAHAEGCVVPELEAAIAKARSK